MNGRHCRSTTCNFLSTQIVYTKGLNYMIKYLQFWTQTLWIYYCNLFDACKNYKRNMCSLPWAQISNATITCPLAAEYCSLYCHFSLLVLILQSLLSKNFSWVHFQMEFSLRKSAGSILLLIVYSRAAVKCIYIYQITHVVSIKLLESASPNTLNSLQIKILLF